MSEERDGLLGPRPIVVSGYGMIQEQNVTVPDLDRQYLGEVDLDPNDDDEPIMDHGLTASLSRGEHTTSNNESLMHLLKGNIGTGILAMPSAIKNAGLWVGTAGIVVIGIVALHCMHLLVRCSHHMCEKTGRPHLDYGGVGKKSIEHFLQLQYDVPLQKRVKIGKATKILINTFLCITQIGFCTVYILFIAQNLNQVIAQGTGYTFNYRLLAFLVFLVLIPFVFVKKLTHLAPFSMMANILTVVGLVIVVQFFFQHLPPVSNYPAFNSWTTLPLYFGIAIYAFEGIGVVLPIENKMERPQDFLPWNGVLNTGMVLVVVMYITVGFYGYIHFGDAVEGSITLNLPQDSWLCLSVKLMFSVGIYISYGLQFYVPMLVMWTGIRRKLSNEWLIRHGEGFLRISFLILTFALAISIPRLDLMISLVGALASSALALIFPPILDILTFWPERKMRWYHVAKDILISLIGVLGFFAGTISTVVELTKPAENK